MLARLVALQGPLRGAVVPLPGGELGIGRDSANTLALAADGGVSRRHCVIQEQDQQFTIRDLGSHNRTYVNDVEVKEHRLEHGDEIRVGHSTLVFLVDGQPAPSPRASVDLDEGQRPSGSTITLRRSETDLRPETLLNELAGLAPSRLRQPRAFGSNVSGDQLEPIDVARPASVRTPQLMKSILRVCQAISSGHRLEELQRSLLKSTIDSIAAERGAILLVNGGGDDFASALHWTRSGGEVRSFRIPRAVLQGVLRQREAVCLSDLGQSGDIPLSPTIVHARLSSIVAAPLVLSDATLGAIYLDSTDPTIRFGPGDLELLTSIAEASAGPLATALKTERLERENERLLLELAGTQPLIGTSERMRVVHRFAMKVAASDATVLVSGASGTGKELVARAIHRNGRRSGKPFVAINCAAITETLLESELFGHEKGAFTGAFAQKKGKLEEADGGTVFLDEIGELAPPLQAKLLRVLQEREFERVGGTRPIKVNIRVIAATNRDLDQEVRRGAFRLDLYFRLNVVSLKMPELRDRREDIPLLAKHFLRKHARAATRRITGVSDGAMSCLVGYDWPGNVRELENAIERAIVLGTTEQILADDLPDSIVESEPGSSPSDAKFHVTIREIKKQLVTTALKEANGNYVDAARRLGLHPNNLHRLMKTLQLKSG